MGGQRPVDDTFPAEGTATRAAFAGISGPRDIIVGGQQPVDDSFPVDFFSELLLGLGRSGTLL